MLGIVLDGIPESAVIGLGLLGGRGRERRRHRGRVPLQPPGGDRGHHRALAGRAGAHGASSASGRSSRWCRALASLAGYAFFDGASPATLAFVLAFAGGAILTMLADTMMPEAFERGGKLVGLATTLGFVVAFAISSLE